MWDLCVHIYPRLPHGQDASKKTSKSIHISLQQDKGMPHVGPICTGISPYSRLYPNDIQPNSRLGGWTLTCERWPRRRSKQSGSSASAAQNMTVSLHGSSGHRPGFMSHRATHKIKGRQLFPQCHVKKMAYSIQNTRESAALAHLLLLLQDLFPSLQRRSVANS